MTPSSLGVSLGKVPTAMSRQGDPSLTFVERHADSIAHLVLAVDALVALAVGLFATFEQPLPGSGLFQATIVLVMATVTNRALDYRNSARRSRELANLTRRVDELIKTFNDNVDQLGRREHHERSDRDRDLQVAALVDRLEQIEHRLPEVDTAYELGRMVGHDEQKKRDEG